MLAFLLMQSAIASDSIPVWRDPPECWDGPQSELTHCAWSEYEAADEKMNNQWRKIAAIMKRLDKEAHPDLNEQRPLYFEALLAGQRAWLKYRDEHCRIFLSGGGSISPMHEGICLRNLTIERTRELAALASEPTSGLPYFEDQ